MTRRELDGRMVQMLYRMTGQKYYLRDIDVVLEAFPYVLAEALHNDETVSIKYFGRFIPKLIEEREFRNPKTGEYHTVAEHRRMKFRPSQSFIQMVQDGLIHIEKREYIDDEVDDA